MCITFYYLLDRARWLLLASFPHGRQIVLVGSIRSAQTSHCSRGIPASSESRVEVPVKCLLIPHSLETRSNSCRSSRHSEACFTRAITGTVYHRQPFLGMPNWGTISWAFCFVNYLSAPSPSTLLRGRERGYGKRRGVSQW